MREKSFIDCSFEVKRLGRAVVAEPKETFSPKIGTSNPRLVPSVEVERGEDLPMAFHLERPQAGRQAEPASGKPIRTVDDSSPRC
jgi:hypothetical protein